MPGAKTKTWGYNAPLLGKTMGLKRGQRVHVTLKNSLPELTTYHWHGMEVPGPITDGGCHAPVYPGEENSQFLKTMALTSFQLFCKTVLSTKIINLTIALIMMQWASSVKHH